MKTANSSSWLLSAAVFTLGIVASPASGQITPDATLPTNSIVLPNGNVLTIEGGTEAGTNLFHSFQEFSIPTGGEAFFNNAITIDNIITRVTGGNLSDIDGLIRANGTANLFLINPNGIQFGPNASLDIGGSFLGSTADSLLFEDGSFFSATEPNASPLLSVNVPVGLQWNQATPAQTSLQGTTLNVANGETLGLLGGNVTLTGSTLNAPGGRVELGGLSASGTVQLNGLQGLSFPEGVSRADVSLSGGSVINVASGGNGSIGVNAGNLTLSASELRGGLGEGLGSVDAVAGTIAIDATGNTTLGSRSLIANDVETGAVGNGGGIELTTGSLALTGGSRIQTVTNSTGTSGEIVVNANGAINISGFTDDGLFSGILSRSATATGGTGGNITINNPQNALNLFNRGFIGAITNSVSDGGSVEANLNTLTLETGGQIVTATTNAGNAGDITINATESVRISGESSDFVFNPFLNLEVFDLDTLDWTTTANVNVEESETVPYVSVERTPEQIISGTTILGVAQDQVDYYSFSVTQGGSRAILDIDGGFTNTPDTDIDAFLFLFNRGTGELLEIDTFQVGTGESSDVFDPGSQANPLFAEFTPDPLIDTTLNEPGVYLVAVSALGARADNQQLIEGATVRVGNTYALNVSVENQGTDGVSLPVDPFDPANFNPNINVRSGVLSESSGIGNTGTLTINTGQLIVNDNGTLFAETFGVGVAGDIILNVETLINLDESGSISSATRGDGDAGNLLIRAEQLRLENGSQIASTTFSSGNTGAIEIIAEESTVLTLENQQTSIGIFVGSEATGNGGLLKIETPVLRVLDGAVLTASTSGDGDGGSIDIDTTLMEVIGNPDSGFFGSISVRSEGAGNGGVITIDTDQLRLLDGAVIDSSTFIAGDAGDVIVRASESVEIVGTNDFFNSSGGIFVNSTGLDNDGNGGNLILETEFLRIADGARITGATFTRGNGGNIQIEATEVEVSEPRLDFARSVSGLSASVQASGSGNGGNLTVNADRLRVINGGQVATFTLGQGNAGDIFLNVDEIEVSGISEDGEFVSRISASSETDFAAGSIEIDADILTVRDGGEISVSSLGSGSAGNLNVDANSIFLDTNASLNADLQAGTQGNITLNTADLRLRRGSNITTNATGDATGGNININTDTLLALENSDISANAEQSFGGRVNIAADGIFGTQFREAPTPESDITATSALGAEFSGVVQIQTPDVDAASGLVALDGDTLDPDTQVRNACAAAVGNRFVLAGSGGFPEDPTQYLRGQTVWRDTRLGEIDRHLSPNPTETTPEEPSARVEPLVEATGWRTNSRGQIELIVASGNPSHSSWQPHPECDTATQTTPHPGSFEQK